MARLQRPASLRDLLLWLECHPTVIIHSRFRADREVRFVGYREGVIFWSDDSFHAIRCQLAAEAELAETGLEFNGSGFTIEKHGFKIRFDYAVQEKPHAPKKTTARRQQSRPRRRKTADE